MSRTKRHKRPSMKLGTLSDHQYQDGKVRDGTPTHSTAVCQHNNWCPYCRGNRTHGNKRREPVSDE